MSVVSIELKMGRPARFTMQEIIDDVRMTSTTERYPVKAKSLTLLELCQSISDLRHTASRSTAQILTRRLYLHPLTISTNAKQQSSKLTPINSIDLDHLNHSNLEKSKTSRKHKKPDRDLAVLSSSFPLMTRMNTKASVSTITNDDSSTEHEASTSTFNSGHLSLPPIIRGISTSSSKRTIANRPSHIISPQKNIIKPNNRWEKVDVWHHLAHTLQRPTPRDPPTTPLDTLTDFYLQNVEQEQQKRQPNYNLIQEIKIYKRNPSSDSIIDEN